MKGYRMNLIDEIGKDFNSYSTKDYYIASFLTAKGFKLTGTNKNGRDIYFVFDDKGKIEKVLPGFYNGTETVSALSMVTAIRNIKSMLHNI
jgi:hypothetical protein